MASGSDMIARIARSEMAMRDRARYADDEFGQRRILVATAATPQKTSRPAVLHGIDWETYSRFLRLFSDKRFRHTYDRGSLEITSPIHYEHENPASLLGDFVGVLTDELNLPRRAGRCLTLRRQKKQRGLEPDNCYWIANAHRLRGKKGCINFRVDPPPDLAIEVEVSRTVLRRMSVYAALNVPELWRLRNGIITFNILRDGKYQVEPKNLTFPQLASADLIPFIAQFGDADDATLVPHFRKWVKQQIPAWSSRAANHEEP
jgi:Uma2 family endonuclease